MLKKILKSMGYNIHKHDYSYTIKRDALVGLAKPERRYFDDSPKYERTLFTLAHEFGHTLQWINRKKNPWKSTTHYLKYFLDLRSKQKDMYKRLDMDNIETFYNELDAWVRGMTFIPKYLLPKYRLYARSNLNTYASMLNIIKMYEYPDKFFKIPARILEYDHPKLIETEEEYNKMQYEKMKKFESEGLQI